MINIIIGSKVINIDLTTQNCNLSEYLPQWSKTISPQTLVPNYSVNYIILKTRALKPILTAPTDFDGDLYPFSTHFLPTILHATTQLLLTFYTSRPLHFQPKSHLLYIFSSFLFTPPLLLHFYATNSKISKKKKKEILGTLGWSSGTGSHSHSHSHPTH